MLVFGGDKGLDMSMRAEEEMRRGKREPGV